jgi:uncharacterized membrane protein YccC
MFKNFDFGVCFYVVFIMTGNSLVAGFTLNLVQPEVTFWIATLYCAIVLFGFLLLQILVGTLRKFFSAYKIRIRLEKR